MRPRRVQPRDVPRVSGSQHPAAWGHRFGPLLACDRCGVRWNDHGLDPHPCAAALPRAVSAEPLEPTPEPGERASRPPGP